MLTVIPLALLATQLPEGSWQRWFCSGSGVNMRVPDSALVLDRTRATSAGPIVDGTRARRVPVFVEQVPFEGEVMLTLIDAGGQIRPPAAMLPPVRGGDDGVFDLRDAERRGETLEAKFTVNFANHPRVTFDRSARTIAIDARDWHYEGRCTPAGA